MARSSRFDFNSAQLIDFINKSLHEEQYWISQVWILYKVKTLRH